MTEEKEKQGSEEVSKEPIPTPPSNNEHNALLILGYILPILFFIPLLTESKDDPFVKFHTNQQLNLLLYYVVGNFVVWFLAFLLIGFLLMPLFWIGGFVFMILGIINVTHHEKKPLPLIGSFNLL